MITLLNGKWDAVRIGNNPLNGALNSEQTAVHACLAYNPNNDTWMVLYFRAADPEPPPYPPLAPETMKTRIWHPPIGPEGVQISSQTIPVWPGGTEKPRLFCGGHSFMHDGKLFAAGGNLGPVAEPFRGLNYAHF